MHNISSTLFLLKIFRRVLWSTGHANVIFGGHCFGLHMVDFEMFKVEENFENLPSYHVEKLKKNEVSHNGTIIEIN